MKGMVCMRLDEFNDAMNKIDPAMIEEAGKKTRTKQGQIRQRVRWGLTAAVAIAIVTVGIRLAAGEINRKTPLGTEGSVTAQSSTGAKEPDEVIAGQETGKENESNVTVQSSTGTKESDEGIIGESVLNYLAQATPMEALLPSKRNTLLWSDAEYLIQASFTDRTAGLFYESNKDEEGNFVYSPAGLYIGLSMLAKSQDDVGASELYRILGIDGNAADAYIQKMLGSLIADEESSICRVSNALWTQEGCWNDAAGVRFQALADVYQADVLSVWEGIWNGEGTRPLSDLIGEWIGTHLKKERSEPFPIEENQSLILLSAVLFQKGWLTGFHALEEPDVFTTAAGEAVSCGMMTASLTEADYLQTERYTAAKVLYEDGSYLMVMLPSEEVQAGELFGSDLTNAVNAFRKGLTERADQLYLSMPICEISCSLTDMQNELKSLGLSAALTEAAFASVSREGSYNSISSISQQNNISFDELGTSADSLTIIRATEAGVEPTPSVVVELALDRPYVYSIVTANGTILYVGVVGNPAM